MTKKYKARLFAFNKLMVSRKDLELKAPVPKIEFPYLFGDARQTLTFEFNGKIENGIAHYELQDFLDHEKSDSSEVE